MQIYNETLRDLLIDPKLAGSKKGLEIREDKKDGVYVEGITEKLTSTVEEVSNHTYYTCFLSSLRFEEFLIN